MHMAKSKKKLKKATPEEFERLLRGETVELSLEGNEPMNCLGENWWNEEVIQINDLEVRGDIALTGNYPYNVEIMGDSVLGDFNIFGEVTTGDFNISGKATTGYFWIYGQATTGYFWISREATTGNFSISDKAKTKRGLLANRGRIKSLVIQGKSTIPRWLFKGGEITESVLVKDLETEELLFEGSGTKFPDEIRLENVKLKALRFVDFRATTNVMITNVAPKANKEDTYLEFTRSSFLKLELIGNRFEAFEFLIFENSDLTSLFMAGTDFPKEVRTRVASAVTESDSGERPQSEIYHKDRRQAKLFFEQVKTVMIGQGNRTGATRYQARELEEHYRLTKFWSRKSILDKITLWFNKYSNGFGTNWLQGRGFS